MATMLSRRELLNAPLGAVIARWLPEWGPARAASTAAVPMYRGNAGRTGENPGPGPAGDPTARWQVRLGGVITSSPAVVNGIVYVGSISPGTYDGGALHAVDAATGIECWRAALAPGDGVLASPAVADGIVAVGSYDGVFIVADAATGEERWRFQTPSSMYLQSPVIAEGVVYLSDTGGHLYALEASDGQERWTYVSGQGFDRSLSSPAIVESLVYCVDVSRRTGDSSAVRAFDRETGQERWTFAPTDDEMLVGTPVVTAGNAYVATRQTVLYRLDALTGRIAARYETGTTVRSQISVSADVIYVGTQEGLLLALDAGTGAARWSRGLSDGAAILSGPTIADGVAYVGDVNGKLYAVDIETGVERWHAGVGSLRSNPAVIDGTIYVGSENGALRAVGGSDTPSH